MAGGRFFRNCSNLLILMVARDGIEPPTPAFSGPRSTTELPGLSEDFSLHFPARDSGERRIGGSSPRTVRCNNPQSIPTLRRTAKRGKAPQPGNYSPTPQAEEVSWSDCDRHDQSHVRRSNEIRNQLERALARLSDG